MEMMEIGMNALRREIGDEDRADSVITAALKKGPARVRIASREEMKMDINKYKNISLRLMEEIKKNGGKAPKYANPAALAKKEDGLREAEGGVDEGAFAHLEQQSNASFDPEGSAMGDSMNADADQLLEDRARMQDQICKLNIDLKDKNNKIIDLLEVIEDIKI